MGNEMGNNNTSGISHESDDAATEVQEKSLQQPVGNNDEKGENPVLESENEMSDDRKTVLASDDSNGAGDDHVPENSVNEEELNVKEADSSAAYHKTEKNVDEPVKDEDSDVQSAQELEEQEKHSERVSVSDKNHLEKSLNKFQKQFSLRKESDDATTESREKSLQLSVHGDDENGENHVVHASENKNMDEKETVLASKDSNGTRDEHAHRHSYASDGEELHATNDIPDENNKTEMSTYDDGEIKSNSAAKELEDHEKSAESVHVSNEEYLETTQNQLQKQYSFTKEGDGILKDSCVTTPSSEPQVLVETNFDESELTEVHSDQSEQLIPNSEKKVDDDLGSGIPNSPVTENGHCKYTCSTNMDETVVSGSDLYAEEKKEELSVTKMTSQEMQFEEKSEENEGESMSTTIVPLNSISDDAEKCAGKLIDDEIKSAENNCLNLEVMANSEISLVEDLPEDKCMVLTGETKLVTKDSETEGNKQDQNYADSNKDLGRESNTDETNVSDTDFLLNPDDKNFPQSENLADSGHCIAVFEDNATLSEGENLNVTELGMLLSVRSIQFRGENADEEKDCKIQEIKDKPEAALVYENDTKEIENIEYLKFQGLPVHSEHPSGSLIHCQDSKHEIAIVPNDCKNRSNSNLELKPESCSESPNTKPTIFHGRSLTVDFLASAIEIEVEKPVQVSVKSISANPDGILENKSSSCQSIDHREFETSVLPKDGYSEAAAESVSRSSTESNPTGFNGEMRKSPSFSLDLQEDERSGESERIPLLYHEKTTIKSTEVEEKVITLEKSDSEKSRTPFLGLLKQGEDEHTVVKPSKQDIKDSAKKATSDSCNKKEASSSPGKLKEKNNKRRSSLFTNCICCTTD